MTQTQQSRLFFEPSKPYYIAARAWVKNSAGVRCTHLLCHALNMAGQTAYLLKEVAINPDLKTPIMVRDQFTEDGIIIYPETWDYPLPVTTKTIVRWLLNRPGFLGGPPSYNDDELIFTFAKSFGDYPLLQLNSSDSRVFYNQNLKRKGICYFIGRNPKPDLSVLPANSMRITKNFPETHEELAKLFNQCEKFYCFDNTALIKEAKMCGCEIILVKDEYFSSEIVPIEQDLVSEEEFFKLLDNFIQITQNHHPGNQPGKSPKKFKVTLAYRLKVRFRNYLDFLRGFDPNTKKYLVLNIILGITLIRLLGIKTFAIIFFSLYVLGLALNMLLKKGDFHNQRFH